MGGVELSTYVGADEVNTPMTPSRLLLIGLTVWGLVMIVPDLVRVVQPLGSLGADNDGLIYDIDGPFPAEASSPAWRAGIRARDQLDLDAMRCKFGKLAECGNALAVLGGVDYVLPSHAVTIDLAARDGRPARHITLIAEQPPPISSSAWSTCFASSPASP
jgi:hypothetical protein